LTSINRWAERDDHIVLRNNSRSVTRNETSGGKLTLRGHFIRLVFAAVLPVSALAAVLVWALVDRDRTTLQDAMVDIARAVSLGVDTEVHRSITALEVLSLDDALSVDNLDAFRTRAEAVRALHGGWSNVLLFKRDGTSLVNLLVARGDPMPRAGKCRPRARYRTREALADLRCHHEPDHPQCAGVRHRAGRACRRRALRRASEDGIPGVDRLAEAAGACAVGRRDRRSQRRDLRAQ